MLSFLRIIALVLLFNACFALKVIDIIEHFQSWELKYGLVIDLGTGGSRIHIFCWPSNSLVPYSDVIYAPPSDPENPWILKTTPGVATFASNPSKAGASLKPLLDFAADKIPESEQNKSKLFIKGTEGLRHVGNASNEILKSILDYASKHSNFHIETRHVGLVSGLEEGVFGWIGVNKLLGSLDEVTGNNTTGVLDMGQGSTQITFVPPPGSAVPSPYNYTFKYLKNRYDLYSHSFAGYGYYASLYSVNATIANQVSASKDPHVENPCFLTGFKQTFYVGEDTKTVKGSGDWRMCSEFTQSFLKKNMTCNYTSCSFDGAFQPPLHGEFFAISNYRDVTEFLRLPSKLTIAEIVEHGESFCSITWDDAVDDYPDIPEDELASYCFGSNYVAKLLEYGYGVSSSVNITMDKYIGEMPASWALGLMIHELQLGHD